MELKILEKFLFVCFEKEIELVCVKGSLRYPNLGKGIAFIMIHWILTNFDFVILNKGS